MARPRSADPKAAFVSIRLTPGEREEMAREARRSGNGLSAYVRWLHKCHVARFSASDQERSDS